MFLSKATRIVNSFLHPSVGSIWCLHRVVENRSIMPSNRELEITPNFLIQLIKTHLSNGYKFVTLDELLNKLHKRRQNKLVNVSFDDGFNDIYHYAYPILKQYKIPFTIYLTSGMPCGETDLWWIHLERIAQNDIQLFETTLQKCYASNKPMADTMHYETHTEPDLSICKQYALSWEQITDMMQSGLCTLGSHSVSHPGLTRIATEQLLTELTDSKHTIERYTKNTIHHFSYPHSMYSDKIMNYVQSIGYSSATLGYGGMLRHGVNPFLLPRVYITES